MAIALTFQNAIGKFAGNSESRKYKAECDDSYPADGYEIGASQYPDGINPFRRLYRTRLDQYWITENDYMGKIIIDDEDDGSDPKVTLHVFERGTGGIAWEECNAGDDLSDEVFYPVVVGCRASMCGGDPGNEV